MFFILSVELTEVVGDFIEHTNTTEASGRVLTHYTLGCVNIVILLLIHPELFDSY